MMKEGFDFERVGKRLPYAVPDGFLAEMEDNVMSRLEGRQRKGNGMFRLTWRHVAGVLTTVAAVMTLMFVVVLGGNDDSRHTDFADVEQAFCNLSVEDQSYLLSVYQDDVFINE